MPCPLVDSRFGHLNTRLADMVKVFSPGQPHGRWATCLSVCLALVLTFALLAPGRVLAQPPSSTKPAAAKQDIGAGKATAKAKGEADAAKDEGGADEPQTKVEKKADDQPPAEPPPDPSQTQKVSPVEIFKDPNAEALLDVKKYNPIRSVRMMPGDVEAVKVTAGNPNAAVDTTVIRRMVDGMVAQLTNTKNIQALIDPPPNMPAGSPTMRAIEEATRNLLEPIYMARAAQNTRFLTEYNRILLRSLQPLLKHHLVPRVQAMIVLGQSGNPEALKLFLDEIRNPRQTLWVKLWAIRGITNIKQNPSARLSAAQEIEAARVVAAQLDEKTKDMPWPLQLRALEALSSLRQGYIPAAPKNAEMAVAAMRILADPKARTEVRAEAARALGMMQITTAVPDYNSPLVAYAAAQLAAWVGDQIVASYSADKGTPLNATKAEYLTALLVGPVYQAFEGQAGVRESGLLHGNATTVRSDIQKVADQIKPVAKAALELIRAPKGQLKARRADLAARVEALKDFLAKNVPTNRHLVPDDDGFLEDAGSQAGAPAEPGAAKVAGATGGK
ncbi:MAG: hypothetical protein JO114_06980 [Planctomycetaceae bacterium]|nr:hypothetical protein [Planctomycetaceae bacterium]